MIPSGMGIFLQGLKPMKEVPATAASLCADNGVRFVLMFAAQQGAQGLQNVAGKPGKIDTIATQQRYTDAFRKKKIDIYLWGYPHAGREAEFVEEMHNVDKAVNARGWCLDPEKSYKGKTSALRNLIMRADEVGKSEDLGITSYGIPSFHKTFPWKEADDQRITWACPQLYLPEIKVAKEAAKLVDKGMEEWGFGKLDFGGNAIVPAVPAFGDNSGAKLHNFLSYFFDNLCTNIGGFAVWSWPQIDKGEWKTISRWANYFKQGTVGP